MTGQKVAILGLGMQGKAALHDLVVNSQVPHIVVVDNQTDLDTYLKRYPRDRVSGRRVNVSEETELMALFKEVDLVVESLPGVFALPTGKAAAKAGVHLISSMYYTNPGEDDPEKIAKIQKELGELHEAAKSNGVVVLTEFGMDPGIDLVIGAQALSELDTIEAFYSYGSGFPEPKARNNPLKYKFTWSPIGVMRSYLRPGKIITDGQVREIPGNEMFFPENRHTISLDEFDGVLECYPNGNSEHYAELFNLKGKVKEMARYTCRWQGHCDFWQVMANIGLLNETPIAYNGTEVSPVQFVSSVLESQSQFRFTDREQDVAFIRIDVRGLIGGESKQIVYQLIDKRDLETGFTSMQRTVGFTMSLGAQMVLEGKLEKTGLLSPIDVPYTLLTNGLKKHGMDIVRQENPWPKNQAF